MRVRMGHIGLKATISGRNPVARRYWMERTALHINRRLEAQTTISTSNGSLVTGSSNNARSTIAIETHIMIFVSNETSSLSRELLLRSQTLDISGQLLRKGRYAG